MQTQALCATDVAISSPKLYTESATAQEARLFPYYAGYSSAFAEEILSSLSLDSSSVVFDPWNGSGTTTQVAHRLGHRAFGIDLNPAMVIAAKAAMLSPLELPSLLPIAQSLVERSDFHDQTSDDPLLQWFAPNSACSVRRIESAINRTLVCNENYIKLNTNKALNNVSPLAAFLYVALFRSVRRLVADFIPSNPTWIKKPKNLLQRKRPSEQKIRLAFLTEVEGLVNSEWALHAVAPIRGNEAVLQIGNAENLTFPDQFFDAVVSSPPYCTRIDYAVSTSIELAILQLNPNEFDSLRRSLTGTSTVGSATDDVDPRWGLTCINFLERLHSHPSKASQSYYYKNHLQYFKSLSRSINELSRVLKPAAYCVLVAQDSHYKEIHNDVPSMTTEMASISGLELIKRLDFSSSRSMVDINGRSRKYLQNRKTTESVLFLRKI